MITTYTVICHFIRGYVPNFSTYRLISNPRIFSGFANPNFVPQIREQMSGPDIHVFTLNFLALKKSVFSCFRGPKKIQKKFWEVSFMGEKADF